MADVYTVTFIVLGMLVSLPGLLLGINLLFPALTGRIERRIVAKPGRNLFLGVPITAVVALWVAIASSTGSGILSGSAFLLAGLYMALGTLGAAGLARLFSSRLSRVAAPSSELTHLVRGAVIFELSCLFPLVGWFVFAPLSGIIAVGAALSSLRPRRPNIAIQIEETNGTPQATANG